MFTLIALHLILVSSCFNPVYPALSSVLEKNLLLHYNFENVRNKIVADGSGNGNNADLINGVSLSPTGCGLGVTFNNGYLNVTTYNETRNTSSLSSPLDITVAAWIWMKDWTLNQPIFSNYFKSSRFQYFVLRRNGVRWLMTDRSKKKIFKLLKNNLTLEERRWHHVAVTFSNETQIGIFYVNGTAYANASRNESVKNDLPPRHDWHSIVGGTPNKKKKRHGTMDEFYIFDKALNETNLKELMRNCTPWKTPSKYVEPTTATTTLTEASTKEQSTVPPTLNTTTMVPTTQPTTVATTLTQTSTKEQSTLTPTLNTTTMASTTQPTTVATTLTQTSTKEQSTVPPRMNTTTGVPTTQGFDNKTLTQITNATTQIVYATGSSSEENNKTTEEVLGRTKQLENILLTFARNLQVNKSFQLNTPEVFIFMKKPTSGFMFPSKKEKDLRKASETLTFPDEMFVTGNKTPRVVVCISYKNLHKILPRKTTISSSFIPANVNLELNSKIIGAAVDPPLSEPLNGSIEVIFTHQPVLNKTHVCSFWNHTINQWSSKGCILNHDKSSSTQTFCECNHLTNFALLLQSEDDPYTSQPLSLEIITIIGSALSILACFLCFIMFVSLKKKDTRHYLHMNLSVAIAVAQLIILVGLNRTKYKVLCKVIAVGLHYFYLVAFLLMLSEGVHLAILIETAFKYGEVKLPMYLIASWGLPLVIVGITLGVRFSSYGGQDACFISAEMGSVYAFLGPFVLVLLINFVILLVVLRQVIRKSTLPISNKAASNMKIARSTIKSLVILFPVLGLTWVFGVLFFGFRGLVLQYLFGIFCSLQGFFIFLFQYVLNTENRTAFLRATKRWRTSTTSRTSSRNYSDPIKIKERTTLNHTYSLATKEPLKIPKDENCELILFRTTDEFVGDQRTVSTFT